MGRPQKWDYGPDEPEECKKLHTKDRMQASRRRGEALGIGYMIYQIITSRQAKARKKTGRIDEQSKVSVSPEYLIGLVQELIDSGFCCPVTGRRFIVARGNAERLDAISCDRIDNTKGYIEGNVRLISNWANIMMQTAGDDDWLKVITHAVNNADKWRA